MNNHELKILCFEDLEADSIIIREQLSGEGLKFQFDHVTNEAEYSDKLSKVKYDIILSDYNLPGFSGIASLVLAKKICPDVPFICISGTIGENLAVELMHLGASDYIMKDHLSKLPVAVKRAIQVEHEHQTRIRAEVSLRESEARFRDIIMSSYDLIWEIDKEWKYCYTSGTIENVLGYSQEEIIGKSPFDFMPEEDKEKVGSSFSKIAGERGIIKDLENWNLHKDGHRVCLLTNGFPIINSAGELTGYRGVDKDITQRKLAEEEIRKLSRATEQSPVSVLITDLNGRITYANQSVVRLTGYSLEELIGGNPKIFSSEENSNEEYEDLWNTLNSGKEWKGEFHNRNKRGELYWESASISPILDEKGRMTHFLAIKEDITERKKLTSDLIEAKVRAEASDRLKTAFLNNISHELRTPLNGILSLGGFLLKPDLQQDEKEACFEVMNESSDRLVNTITNYMDMSLLFSGNISAKIKPVNLTALLDKIYQKFLSKSIGKKLEFVNLLPTGINNYFICDEGLLEKAISHLVDNAIKFTVEGSIILGANITDKEYELFVKDTGLGIDAEAQSNVFKFFMQEDLANTRGFEGSGLGLTIAKGLVELMGGSIRMNSVKGKGSSFYLNFPVAV
jgi:PAS domain S-box-containing protein